MDFRCNKTSIPCVEGDRSDCQPLDNHNCPQPPAWGNRVCLGLTIWSITLNTGRGFYSIRVSSRFSNIVTVLHYVLGKILVHWREKIIKLKYFLSGAELKFVRSTFRNSDWTKNLESGFQGGKFSLSTSNCSNYFTVAPVWIPVQILSGESGFQLSTKIYSKYHYQLPF